jgi:hypothetical protein
MHTERLIAKMGSLLPYRRARTLLSEFLPLADVPAVETARRRTVRVGARLEKLAVAGQPPVPVDNARAIADPPAQGVKFARRNTRNYRDLGNATKLDAMLELRELVETLAEAELPKGFGRD